MTSCGRESGAAPARCRAGCRAAARAAWPRPRPAARATCIAEDLRDRRASSSADRLPSARPTRTSTTARSPRPSCRRSARTAAGRTCRRRSVLMTACVSGASMKSAKALPPAAFTAGPVGRIDLHHRVDVQQRPVPLDQDREVDALLEGEQRAAIGQRVGLAVVGDAERGAHALPRLDVPGRRRRRRPPASRAPARARGCPTCRRARRSAPGRGDALQGVRRRFARP